MFFTIAIFFVSKQARLKLKIVKLSSSDFWYKILKNYKVPRLLNRQCLNNPLMDHLLTNFESSFSYFKGFFFVNEFGLEDEGLFGFGSYTPKWMQFFNKLSWFTFFMFSMCVFQGEFL